MKLNTLIKKFETASRVQVVGQECEDFDPLDEEDYEEAEDELKKHIQHMRYLIGVIETMGPDTKQYKAALKELKGMV